MQILKNKNMLQTVTSDKKWQKSGLVKNQFIRWDIRYLLIKRVTKQQTKIIQIQNNVLIETLPDVFNLEVLSDKEDVSNVLVDACDLWKSTK